MELKKIIKNAPGAVPATEERVYLYQKSGNDALKELLDKRSRYVELDKSLQVLPTKLRHRGIIPLGPGVFGHGQIVNTNEVLVLLGNSYFAQMSAHDARNVVSRRLSFIDEKISNVQVGKNDVDNVIRDINNLQASSPPPPSSSSSLSSLPNSSKKPSTDNGSKSPAFKKGFLDAVYDSEPPRVSGRKPPRSPKIKNDSDMPRKRVSFAPDSKIDTVEGVNVQSTRNMANTNSTSKADKGETSSRENRPESQYGNTAQDTEMKTLLRGLVDNMDQSLKIAKEHQDSSEIVNFSEHVDEDGNVQNVIGLPSGGSNHDDDDVSVSDVPTPNQTSTDVRNAHESAMKDLLKLQELEEKEELDKQRSEKIEKEDQESSFFSGFKKGFLDKPATSVTKQSAPASIEEIHKSSTENKRAVNETSKKEENGDEIDATENEKEPIAENVVMKSVKERTGRRRRRRSERASTAENDENNIDERPTEMSQFMQMRARMRQKSLESMDVAEEQYEDGKVEIEEEVTANKSDSDIQDSRASISIENSDERSAAMLDLLAMNEDEDEYEGEVENKDEKGKEDEKNDSAKEKKVPFAGYISDVAIKERVGSSRRRKRRPNATAPEKPVVFKGYEGKTEGRK